ncbi:unnamed protein product [Citrullus colocynthis]|uniref:C-JID domain-containing protein n=1 Tax=Citrullus colocynthis TaxID=252529 RepID=A0ABP0Y0N6_9ROSI
MSRSWFNLQLEEPKVTIKMPPNLHKDKRWMGFAFFVIFAVDEKSPKSHSFSYQVENDEYTMERESILYLNEELFDDSHQLWLFFEPRAVFPYRLNQWRHLGVSFICNNSDFEAVLCGAGLVYKQDIEGLMSTIVSNMLSSPTEFHELFDQLYVEEMLSIIHFHKYDPKQGEEERRQDLCIQEWVEEQNSDSHPQEDSTPTSNMERNHILQLKETIPSFLQKDLQGRPKSQKRNVIQVSYVAALPLHDIRPQSLSSRQIFDDHGMMLDPGKTQKSKVLRWVVGQPAQSAS